MRRDTLYNWYACFSCKVAEHPLPTSEKAVGIDVGLESFATLSTGEKITNPRFFRQEEKALAKAQRRLSAAEKGTPERAKRRKVVEHIYKRIANGRKDFAHQLSRHWVDKFGLMAFERLNTRGMFQNHCLAKSIADAAWNQLVQYTAYKVVEAGRMVVLVDTNGTSQRCSCCGTVVIKALSVRGHKYPVCGLQIDRDENAPTNILSLGLESFGAICRSHAASAAVE